MVRLAPKHREQAAEPPPEDSELEEVALGEIPDHEPYVRCDASGVTRGNVASVAVLSEGSEARGLGSYCEYVAVRENRSTGATYLVPTVKSNANKLAVRWADANHAFYVSLRKYLKAKKFKVSRGHTWLIPCARAELKSGVALELKLKEAREEPVTARGNTPTTPTA